MSRIVAVTCTRDRPMPFANCQRIVARQTRPCDLWIVVDDGDVPAAFNRDVALPTLLYMRRQWTPSDGSGHTLILNLRMALTAILPDDTVIMAEDDEWLHPQWFETVAAEIGGYDIAGMGNNLYWDVRTRRYLYHHNREHANLAATALARAGIDALREECDNTHPFIDARLWGLTLPDLPAPKVRTLKKRLFMQDKPMVVGIKGLPGREGADGHAAQNQKQWPVDSDASHLRTIIGNDVEGCGYGHLYVGSTKAAMMVWGPKPKGKS